MAHRATSHGKGKAPAEPSQAAGNAASSEQGEENEEEAKQKEPWVDVTNLATLQHGNGVRFRVRGRYVALWRWHEQVFALDALCYHSRGPLDMGDIEEVGDGVPAVRCPWHSFRIVLLTGQSVYLDLSNHFKAKPGLKQRNHRVRIRSGRVHVQLVLHGPAFESDAYATGPDARWDAQNPDRLIE